MQSHRDAGHLGMESDTRIRLPADSMQFLVFLPQLCMGNKDNTHFSRRDAKQPLMVLFIL